jgi:hypothetical protein
MQHPLVGVISTEHQAVFPPSGGKANSIAKKKYYAIGIPHATRIRQDDAAKDGCFGR